MALDFTTAKIVDFTTSVEGKLAILTSAGIIYSRDLPNSFEWQHLPESARPEFVWNEIPGPGGRVTRIIAGSQFDLHAIADGKLWRRVRDLNSMIGERFRWVEVNG